MRTFCIFPTLILASCLAAASADPHHACAAHAGPSNFDYMVLASIADSPHLLAMASYLTTAKPHGAPVSPDRSADKQYR